MACDVVPIINPFTGRLQLIQNGTGGGGGTGVGNFNEYAELDLSLSLLTTIFSYTVPTAKTLYIYQMTGWGDVDGEYLIKIDGVIKGGGRTSAADRTLQLVYMSPLIATVGQLVQVQGEQHVKPTKLFRINLIGDLL